MAACATEGEAEDVDATTDTSGSTTTTATTSTTTALGTSGDSTGDLPMPDCEPFSDGEAFVVDAAQRAWIAQYIIVPACGPVGSSDAYPTIEQVSPEGELEEFLLHGSSFNGDAPMAASGDYVAVAGNQLVVYNLSSDIVHRVSLPGNARAIAIANDATTYVSLSSGGDYSIQRDAPSDDSFVFELEGGIRADFLAAAGGGLVAGTTEPPTLQNLDRDGARQWIVELTAAERITAMAADESGRIYFASLERDIEASVVLRRVTPDGEIDGSIFLEWPVGIASVESLAVSEVDELICAGVRGKPSEVQCLDLGLQLRWSKTQSHGAVHVLGDSVWYTTLPGQLVRVDGDGAELWRTNYD